MFGRNVGARTAVSESQWGRFVDREIMARFPEGLTVYTTAGQWRDRASNKIMREPSKVVQIVLPGHDDDMTRLSEIAEAYKARFKQQSVSHDRAAGLRVVLGSANGRGRALTWLLLPACAAGGCFLITSTQDQNATGRQGARVMDQVKFVALDRDDLEVVSTHLQDALVKVADVIWRPQEKRLVVGAEPLRLARGGGNQARAPALPLGAAFRAGELLQVPPGQSGRQGCGAQPAGRRVCRDRRARRGGDPDILRRGSAQARGRVPGGGACRSRAILAGGRASSAPGRHRRPG